MRSTRRFVLALAAAVALLSPMFHPARAEDKPVLVFAAASLKESLGKVAEAFTANR
jgi:ABC-type molybdate transport system substrate-binding protein